jgi:hypothetical protein
MRRFTVANFPRMSPSRAGAAQFDGLLDRFVIALQASCLYLYYKFTFAIFCSSRFIYPTFLLCSPLPSSTFSTNARRVVKSNRLQLGICLQ